MSWRPGDRDVAAKLGVLGAVDLARATFAEFRDDFIDADAGSSEETHGIRDYSGRASLR